MYSYVPPQVNTADEIRMEQQLIDDDFIELQTKFDQVNDVSTEQKKHQKITDLIDDVINENNSFNSFDEFLWEEDLFDKNGTQETVEVSKNILDEISQKDPFISFKPITETIVPDDEVIVEGATDDETDDEVEEIETTPAYVQWDPENTAVSAEKRPRVKLSTDYNRKLKATNKIKNKERKKVLGNKKTGIDLIEKRKETSQDLLKNAGYLDTENQESINYIYVPPKETFQNKIPADAGHFIWSEIDSTDLKKSNLATKIIAKKIVDECRKQARKKPYTVPSVVLEEATNAEDFDNTGAIETLEDIASLQPGKSAQL